MHLLLIIFQLFVGCFGYYVTVPKMQLHYLHHEGYLTVSLKPGIPVMKALDFEKLVIAV